MLSKPSSFPAIFFEVTNLGFRILKSSTFAPTYLILLTAGQNFRMSITQRIISALSLFFLSPHFNKSNVIDFVTVSLFSKQLKHLDT